ncbi:MAG: CRISPR-associated endonuclease Cas2 [Candidatus Brocadiia bacterium]
MYQVVTYDVNTETKEGRRRLRRVAKTCEGFGFRVQHSVFECSLSEEQFFRLKDRLLAIIDRDTDSLRFYRIHEPHDENIEEYGISNVPGPDSPLVL